jgi:hypothetical protein
LVENKINEQITQELKSETEAIKAAQKSSETKNENPQ